MTGSRRAFLLIGLWALAALLVVIEGESLVRALVAGSFQLTAVGVSLAVALPSITGLGRFALVVMGGLSSWLLNGLVLVYTGVLPDWPAAALLSLTVLECAAIAAASWTMGNRKDRS